MVTKTMAEGGIMAQKKSWPFERITKGKSHFVRVTCVRTGSHKEMRIKRSYNNYEIDKIIQLSDGEGWTEQGRTARAEIFIR